ncbi:hypothetical protein PENDEC_c001G03247 [Penicillium decumbens]|uniref:Uncharacterized protein n=1 Tax=Penicillium decumbens TaxID=69771 RepID=A0A1V6PN16_PENDC|nr:hypothetical protein PENDEC_c001G03247 [Penicillium decumbens]
MNHPDITRYQTDPEADWRTLPVPDLSALIVVPVTIYDQATNLPPPSQTAVLPILGPDSFGFKLSSCLEIDQWLANVNNILTTYHLNRLIDVRIPRPKRKSQRRELADSFYASVKLVGFQHVKRYVPVDRVSSAS